MTSRKLPDGSVLPFPPTPSASVAGPTLQTSKHRRRVEKSHLSKDPPNILIILLDNVGFGLPDTFGGPIHTPTLTRHGKRRHQLQRIPHHVDLLADPRGAVDRAQPSSRRYRHDRRARARLGRLYGRDSAHSGDPRQGPRLLRLQDGGVRKWHNTPATETTAMGPFTNWPTGEGIGFDYFYGFLAGETSQWEPRLYENFNPVEPPHDEKYHLSEDLADKAIAWLRKHQRLCAGQALPHVLGVGRRRTGRTTSSRSGPTSTKASSTMAGMRCARKTLTRQKDLGWIPQMPS